MATRIRAGDALIIVDLQNDFLPGGALGVPGGDETVPVLNQYIARFEALHLPVFATRDWHPVDHCSFREQGGNWPPHCIANTPGAGFAEGLRLPRGCRVVSKALDADREAYSGFMGTDLEHQLRRAGVERVFIGGLATDYCVLNTVRDARACGFGTYLLTDAIRAVNVHSGDGHKALDEMLRQGAHPVTLENVE